MFLMMKYVYYVTAVITVLSVHVFAKINFTVVENTQIGRKIGNVCEKLNVKESNCSDLEIEGNNGQKTLFRLDKQNGDLFVNKHIDREKVCLEDEDCIVPLTIQMKSGLVEVSLYIEDENDNFPKFTSKTHLLCFDENTAINRSFELPVAKDTDSWKYGVTNYSIKDVKAIGSNDKIPHFIEEKKYFKVVNTSEGSDKVIKPYLVITGNIDREIFRAFEFLLIATDSGHKSDTCSVTVLVNDVNDNPPICSHNYKININECDPPGKELIEFSCTDADDSVKDLKKIFYRFNNNKNKSMSDSVFAINGTKLYLRNNKISNIIQVNRFTLVIDAVDDDGKGKTSNFNVSVTIDSCNKNPPKIIISKVKCIVPENDDKRIVLANVTVIDEDLSDNGRFICYINDTSLFSLEMKHVVPNGKFYELVKMNGVAFDREDLPEYYIEITCEDFGKPEKMSSSRTFEVTVVDMNDNGPRFNNTNTVFNVLENLKIGTSIGHVYAYDADKGPNSLIVYSIAGNSSCCTITTSGDIQTKIKFDRESNNTHYNFTVVATDGGHPPLSVNMTVSINVLDENDNAPKFIHRKDNTMPVNISSNANIGASVFDIKAVDPDNGANGSVTYQINCSKQNTQWCPFKINSEGKITVSDDLKQHDSFTYELTITAEDNGVPKRSNSITLFVVYRNPISSSIGQASIAQHSTMIPQNYEGISENPSIRNYVIIIASLVVIFCIAFILVFLLVLQSRCFKRFSPPEEFVKKMYRQRSALALQETELVAEDAKTGVAVSPPLPIRTLQRMVERQLSSTPPDNVVQHYYNIDEINNVRLSPRLMESRPVNTAITTASPMPMVPGNATILLNHAQHDENKIGLRGTKHKHSHSMDFSAISRLPDFVKRPAIVSDHEKHNETNDVLGDRFEMSLRSVKSNPKFQQIYPLAYSVNSPLPPIPTNAAIRSDNAKNDKTNYILGDQAETCFSTIKSNNSLDSFGMLPLAIAPMNPAIVLDHVQEDTAYDMCEETYSLLPDKVATDLKPASSNKSLDSQSPVVYLNFPEECDSSSPCSSISRVSSISHASSISRASKV